MYWFAWDRLVVQIEIEEWQQYAPYCFVRGL